MRFPTAISKHIFLTIIHSNSLKKLKPLRILLRHGARACASLLKFFSGFRFPSSWSWYSKLEFLLGLYEHGTTLLCKKLIKPGMIAIDIGANVGYYTLLFSRLVGANGRVYAFEPHPEIVKLLRHNVKNIDNVVVLQKALSNRNGEVDFFFSKRTSGSHGFCVPDEFLTGSCKVEAVSLDDFLRRERIEEVDLIKIDVEGAEPLVIEGMSNLLSRSKRLHVIMEFNPSALRLGHIDPEAFLEIICEKFDSVYCIDEKNGSLLAIEGTTIVKNISEWHAINLFCFSPKMDGENKEVK